MQTKENNQSYEDLILGYLNGELDAEEKRELINWLKLDNKNKQYYDEISEIWVTSKAFSRHSVYNFHSGFWKFRQRINPSEKQPGNLNNHVFFKTVFRYAAIFIIAFSISGFLFTYLTKKRTLISGTNSYELLVPLGSHAQFTLSDGTKVTLNAGSRLTYSNFFDTDERVVQLEGEGFFKVTKDPKRPFIVQTSHLNVIALGTTFNIKAYRDDKTIETTLVEGSVKIEEFKDRSKSEGMILKPNQQLIFRKIDSKMIEGAALAADKRDRKAKPVQVNKTIAIPPLVSENVDVEPIISWKEDRWIFEKKSLSQIAVELERRFDVKIVFESERLKSFRFTGIILAEPIDQVLQVMSITAPISFKVKGRVVTLSENKSFAGLNKHLYVK